MSYGENWSYPAEGLDWEFLAEAERVIKQLVEEYQKSRIVPKEKCGRRYWKVLMPIPYLPWHDGQSAGSALFHT